MAGEITTTTAASTTSTSTALTTILYPTGLPTVNYEDTVFVSYKTPWPGTNMSVYCDDGEGSTGSYDKDNLPSSGVVNLSPIQGSLDLSAYPALCNIVLTDSKNSGQWINEGIFSLASTSGAVKTYGASSTGTAPTSTVSTTQQAPTPTVSTTQQAPTTSLVSTENSTTKSSSTLLSISKETGTASPKSSISSAPSSSSSSPSSSTSSPSSSASSSNSALSGGAKAGIAISVLLIFFLLLAALIYHCRRRRRRGNPMGLPVAGPKPTNERAASRTVPKTVYASTVKKSSLKTSSSTPGPKVLSAQDMRQSGDWKTFFSAKAASAAGSLGGAAAAVGSAISNSRSGSRRASMARSRLSRQEDGGKEQKELPGIPPIPQRASIITNPHSPIYFSESVAGDGTEYMSTTSLVGRRRDG